MNSRREQVGIRRRSERPESGLALAPTVSFVRGGPDVIASEIHVLPAQGGKVLQELVGDVLKVAQRGDRAPKVSGVPEDNRGDEKI
jgi:hypothetical protein